MCGRRKEAAAGSIISEVSRYEVGKSEKWRDWSRFGVFDQFLFIIIILQFLLILIKIFL